jgi:hypothetical protein
MRYRKKPIEVEAEVYKPGMEDGIESHCHLPFEYTCETKREDMPCRSYPYTCNYGIGKPYIETLEGPLYISPGDYIITGIKNERYPCKPDIFELIYEEAYHA